MTQHFYGDDSNLNAPYDAVPLQGLGQVDDHPNAPWRQFSPEVQGMQQQLNDLLRQDGGCPLLADGVIGPRTCGALSHYGRGGDVLFTTCAAHQEEEPWISPEIPCPPEKLGPPPPSEELVTPPSTKSSIPPWAIGLGLGALAIGVALMLKKKKGRR